MEICLLGGDFSSSSLEQMQLKPPNKLAIMWANPSSPAAPSPNLKACSLGSLHSNIHRRKCFTYTITTLQSSNHHHSTHGYALFSNEYLVLCNISFDGEQASHNIHSYNQQTNQHANQLHGILFFFVSKQRVWNKRVYLWGWKGSFTHYKAWILVFFSCSILDSFHGGARKVGYKSIESSAD